MKINITIPVLNEEKVLENSINNLILFLKQSKFPYDYEIVIADNASTDNTANISKKLEKKYKQTKYLFVPKRGKGIAIRTSWLKSNCDILSFMDVDMSSDLNKFKPLVEAITKHKYQIAVGSRLNKKSKVIGRTILREILSRGFNLIIFFMFFPKFKDAECGFKAIDATYFKKIEPLIKSNSWLFDTEMLLVTNKLNKKIASLPLTWKDKGDSRMKVGTAVIEHATGLIATKFRFMNHPSFKKRNIKRFK